MLIWWITALAEPVDADSSGQEEETSQEATTSEVETAEPEVETAEPEVKPSPTPAAEPESYTIPSLDVELPSALHTGKLEAGEDDGSLKAVLGQYGMGERDFEKPSLVRGGWFVRPRLAISALLGGPTKGPIAMRTGLSAGRRFWTLQVLPIQVAADLGLRFTAPIGGASGRRLEGFANIGPWLGPARIQIGLAARWEREFWHRKVTELRDVIHLGPMVQVAFDLKYLQANVGFSPAGKIWGTRTSGTQGDPVLPVLGHETTWSAGLAAPIGVFRLGGDVAWRDTDRGGLLEVGLMLGLDLAAIRRSSRNKSDDEEDTSEASDNEETEE